MSLEELFGAPIHVHTRQDLLNDGDLIDISNLAKEAGIKFSVAVTRGVWGEVVEPDEVAINRGESKEGRTWDVLTMLRFGMLNSKGGSVVHFSVIATKNGREEVRKLRAECGPGDNMEPVITVLLPNED